MSSSGKTDFSKKTIQVVAAVVERNGRYLITQRRQNAVLPLLWEFPGGKVEPGESNTEALRREMRERLGVEVEVGVLISQVMHEYESYSVELWLYDCAIFGREPEVRAVNDFKWVASSDFEQFSFTPADEVSMSKLLGVKAD